MAEQRSDNMTAEMEEEGLTILQKIEDMEIYALPLIERWSIAHQKLLGDDIAHCMNRMSQLASALTVAYYKKTSISELDETNKALQSHIRVAYRLGYLKGKSSRSEWEGRSAEIGRMIGKYKEWVYGDQNRHNRIKVQNQGTAGNDPVVPPGIGYFVCRSAGATGTTLPMLACST
ncbi:four helix bundle protein [Blautia fusiformis]|uniref:Four helix bundle protein n=1 Tax=Blautia fusiformis TaxID=2881264 RepID=A0AAW4W1F5_9FIRM|nr:four helix bundle protein [Blautia fusiformis]MCC2226315.1 four helix bundle protein [Blautia fusiformis]